MNRAKIKDMEIIWKLGLLGYEAQHIACKAGEPCIMLLVKPGQNANADL